MTALEFRPMAHGRQPGIITLKWAVFHSGSRFEDGKYLRIQDLGRESSKYLPQFKRIRKALPDELTLQVSSVRDLFHCGEAVQMRVPYLRGLRRLSRVSIRQGVSQLAAWTCPTPYSVAHTN